METQVLEDTPSHPNAPLTKEVPPLTINRIPSVEEVNLPLQDTDAKDHSHIHSPFSGNLLRKRMNGSH